MFFRYGNPGNPLENFDHSDLQRRPLEKTSLDSIGMELDKESEAIKVLDDTRKFWEKTWKTAMPVAAAEQEALFDAGSTAEMTLDFLETIHPANLLCQVMAVNLAMAYFVLVVSAEDSVMVGMVRTSLVRFRENVCNALALLAQDATDHEATRSQDGSSERDSAFSTVSIESLAACSRACLSLSEAEVQVARAKSLLHKLPKQFKTVEKLMSQPNGSIIQIGENRTRRAILKSISQQQAKSSGTERTDYVAEPTPTVREYVLRNNSEKQPCQLCVKYKDGGSDPDTDDGADIVLALSRTERLG